MRSASTGMYLATNACRRSKVSGESTFTFSTSVRIRSRTGRSGSFMVYGGLQRRLAGTPGELVPDQLREVQVLAPSVGHLGVVMGAHYLAQRLFRRRRQDDQGLESLPAGLVLHPHRDADLSLLR